MAAKKRAKKKSRAKKKLPRYYRPRFRSDPVADIAREKAGIVHAWRLWNHDLDTILHELVKNPALSTTDPTELVARAVAFADALRHAQDARRPAELTREDDFR